MAHRSRILLTVRSIVWILVFGAAWSAPSAAGPGDFVYENAAAPPNRFAPGAGAFMADDLTLEGGACRLGQYDLTVYRLVPGADFTVDVVLLDGDPCVGGAAIPGTECNGNVVSGNGTDQVVTCNFPGGVDLPTDTVWMTVTFSDDNAAWRAGEQAELGSTQDLLLVGQPLRLHRHHKDRLLRRLRRQPELHYNGCMLPG